MVSQSSKREPSIDEVLLNISVVGALLLWTLFFLIYNYHVKELEVVKETLQSKPYQELERRVRLLEEKAQKNGD